VVQTRSGDPTMAMRMAPNGTSARGSGIG
jgi:hypothetical protein